MDGEIEHEICGNCKKEIPQHNYVMHTAHCSRNITLCQVCKEPIPKIQLQDHKKKCLAVKPKKSAPPPPTNLEKSDYYQERKSIEDKKASARKERRLQKIEKLVDTGYSLKTSSPQISLPKPSSPQMSVPKTSSPQMSVPKTSSPKTNSLLACKYCDLELPKLELAEHEDYCGTRTEKCPECGEFVKFQDKQTHIHRVRPRPSVDSTSYAFPLDYTPPLPQKEKGESYKDISRRLDCKTEYIRNLLHDSASITVPLRHGGMPRNRFNHDKGAAPLPPRRRPNPPTELTIPCEFCNVPIPHEDLIQHETGCRPDLARYNPRRRTAEEEYFEAAQARDEEELPCEFCSNMIPASQLWRHQATCF